MKSSGLSRHALAIGTASALLVGCGASPTPIGAPGGAMPQSRAITTRADRGGSWMLPEAKSGALLYVVTDASLVYVVDYATGKLEQTLNFGSGSGTGACVDARGDVFVTAFIDWPSEGGFIFEYAHGGTSPITTLADGDYTPSGCSVDPLSGNLAVTNDSLYSAPGRASVGGNLAIYAGASGNPIFYTDPGIQYYDSGTYDGQGNIFVIGSGASTAFGLAELPKGGSTFENFTLDSGVSGSHIQWDGASLAITKSAGYHRTTTAKVYRIDVSGSSAILVGTTTFHGLLGARAGLCSWIQGKTIIVSTHQGEFGIWRYPRGGKEIRKIGGLAHYRKYGVTLSPAS